MFYYHHILWEKISLICAAPCLLFVLYRFIFCQPDKWENVIVREKYSSLLSSLNFLSWDYWNGKKVEKDDEKTKGGKIILKEDFADKLYKFYLILGAIHYSFDSCVKIYYYGTSIIYEECKLWYFIHHVLTLFKFKSTWMLDHYTWF